MSGPLARPLRVCFVAGSMGGGGAERQLVDLLKHLDRRRVTPQLYLQYRRGELLPEIPADIPVDAFWDGDAKRSLLQRGLAKLRCPCAARALHLRETLVRRPADVIMSWSLMCVYETALATLGRRVPHVGYIIVEPDAEVDDALSRSFPFRHRLARWAYRSTTKVLANSAVLRERTEQYYDLPADRTGTLLNCRDFERVDRLATSETPSWPGVGRRIVAAGRLRHQKGFDLLLEAVARVHSAESPVQLAILGQGPDQAELEQQAAKLGIAEQVHFLGFQTNPFSYFRTADVFILPSRFEGNPNTLIEAVACRVPVVAADCPTGPREILEGGRWGRLVPVEDVGALATALKETFESPPADQQLDAARQSVLDRFGLGVCVDQLITMFETLAAENQARK
ncbi:MAG TPA: glycosyltransferase [Planctomycetaceae bacterium]|nr:glycosyltransferase [Planctomycetaceae bacterium]